MHESFRRVLHLARQDSVDGIRPPLSMMALGIGGAVVLSERQVIAAALAAES